MQIIFSVIEASALSSSLSLTHSQTLTICFNGEQLGPKPSVHCLLFHSISHFYVQYGNTIHIPS